MKMPDSHSMLEREQKVSRVVQVKDNTHHDINGMGRIKIDSPEMNFILHDDYE